MLEFIFFHDDICRQFIEFIARHNTAFSMDEDGDTITVLVSEDEDDDLIERLEAEYDRLLDLSREQTDKDEGETSANYQKASLLVTLKNGERSYAHVDTDLVNRILKGISTEELNTFIENIVDAVENPDERSYCQIITDTDNRQ